MHIKYRYHFRNFPLLEETFLKEQENFLLVENNPSIKVGLLYLNNLIIFIIKFFIGLRIIIDSTGSRFKKASILQTIASRYISNYIYFINFKYCMMHFVRLFGMVHQFEHQ